MKKNENNRMSDFVSDISKKAMIVNILGYKVTHALGLFVVGSFALIGFMSCYKGVRNNVRSCTNVYDSAN